jgi:Family of unknown function (DUF6390)
VDEVSTPKPATPRSAPATAGPTLFARYAYPPNERGSCGPPQPRTLFEYGAAAVVDPGLEALARQFAGAWPYLEFIAGVSGIRDPLDARVVEAYWLGNDLLDRIDMATFGNALMTRFRRQAGRSWNHLAEAIPAGVVPHHSFHVFHVYPWVGLLGNGRGEPLEVLHRCRIRWGQVISVERDSVIVRSRPLRYDRGELYLGPQELETATTGLDGVGLATGLKPGEWVGLHWGWVCDRLTPRQLSNLRRFTVRHLEIVNARLEHSGPALTLG